MNTKKLKALSYFLPVILFFAISFSYMSPTLGGKKLQGGDIKNHMGSAKEIIDYRNETGEEALWTNSMFGGMPAYLISVMYPGELFRDIQNLYFKIPVPVIILSLSFLFFYILCLIIGIRPWISFAASLAYGFMTFTFVIMAAGHLTKAHTLAHISLVVAGILMAFRQNRIAGSVIAGIGLAWMISANHLQMTYYAAILIITLGITYLIYAIKEKEIGSFLKTSSLLVIAAIIAIGANFSRLYTTYEYGKYSMRSKSELSSKNDEKTTGLDKSYILDYSYDLGEAMTAFIPRFKGGGMAEPLGEKSNFYKFIQKLQGKKAAREIAKNAPLYWGSQPISVAPFYFGAILCFLFVFGLFVVKGKDKWWLLVVFIVSFLLSLGKNVPLLADFMVDYFPGYNKFRDVKNIVVIQQFSMALLGVLAVRELMNKKHERKRLLKHLKYSFIIVGGLAFLFVLIPGIAGTFEGRSDAQYLEMGWPHDLIEALRADRKAVLRADAFRSLIFVSIAAAGIWAYLAGKIKGKYALALWVALIGFDMWPVNKKYLNNDNFISERKEGKPFQQEIADEDILKDEDIHFRVLNFRNPFADSRTSYFHKSIGGYHGAKMKRYNEAAIERISPEIQRLISSLQNNGRLDSVLNTLSVINMLNTKYFIYSEKNPPILNSAALGNAWFVRSAKIVDSPDEEFAAIADFKPQNEAIIDRRFAALIDQENFNPEGSYIELEEYKPNYLKYNAKLNSGQLAVFSEIYYPKGWKSFVNSEQVDHFRVNYLLRALVLPEGELTVEFKFEPGSYFVGNKISLASSIILLLAALSVLTIELKKMLINNNNEELRQD